MEASPGSARPDVRRAHLIAMALFTAIAVGHHCALFMWYVDDSAITWAYSVNLASGEGIVPFAGGERVEGYSNPAWMFFLVPFAFVGLDLHQAVAWIQIALVAATVNVVYLAGRELFRGEDDRHWLTRHGPLIPPAILGVSALFATWTSAGLEMALMDLLMAVAVWRSLVELRTGEWPWSALAWLGVALCRPEAILYAAVAGFWAMVVQFRAGRGVLPTAKWLLTFFLPMGLYQAWRYIYFAWELPNTYYAKLERRPSFPIFDWISRSWRYTRNFAHNMGWGYYVPIWTMGAIGGRGWRWSAALAMGAVGALTIALGIPDQHQLLPAVVFGLWVLVWSGLGTPSDPAGSRTSLAVLGVAVALVGTSLALRAFAGFEVPHVDLPEFFFTTPPIVLGGLGLGALALAYTDTRTPGRALVLSLCLAAVFFAVIAQWDWMKGYRWYAPAAVPGALVFGLGLHHLAVGLADHFGNAIPLRSLGPRTWSIAVVTVAIVSAVPLNVLETIDRIENPDASPRGVYRRTRFVQGVEQRLHLEERMRSLDVDMGGQMLWSDFEMVDIAGLVDVPLGHHKFQPPFVDEYIFEEQRPHYVHLHGPWERNSGIKRRPAWRDTYIEIPGYPSGGRKLHIGNHVRRDLVLPRGWPEAPMAEELQGGIVVHGVVVPSAPPEGGKVYVEVGLAQRSVPERADFRVWLSARDAEGEVRARWDVNPGYGWISVREWRADEVFVGKFDFRLPDAMAPGDYALFVTVIGADGEPRRTLRTDETKVAVGTLTVLTRDDAGAAAVAKRKVAEGQAADGECESATRQWYLARKHAVATPKWEQRHETHMRRRLADCWARVAADLAREGQVAALVKAREFDHWSPAYRVAARELAGALYAEGHEARDVGDWEGAYRAFSDAVAVDRSWSWARRYAEEARAHRLGLGEQAPDQSARK